MKDGLPQKRRSRGRRIVVAAAITIGLVCVLWTGLWYLAAWATGNAIETWFADEKLEGRNWACADRSTKGFPLRIEFRCAQPRLTMTVNGVAVVGSIGDIVADADVYRPRLIKAKPQSPLEVSAQDGSFSLQLAWQDFGVVVEVSDETLKALSLTLTQVTGKLQMRNRNQVVADSGHFRFSLHQNGEAKDVLRTIDARIEALDIKSDHLDQLTNTRELAQMNVTARAMNADLSAAISLPHLLESWRLSQGSLEIDKAHLGKGTVSIDAQGSLSLDALRRIQGNITIDAANVASIAQKLGIPASAFAIGDLLSGFLGGQRKDANPAEVKPTRVSIRMENGRVLLGPVPLPLVLLPLY